MKEVKLKFSDGEYSFLQLAKDAQLMRKGVDKPSLYSVEEWLQQWAYQLIKEYGGKK